MGSPEQLVQRDAGRSVVVVPTYNELDNIARLIDEVLASADVDILVVDDSSPDGTAAEVTAHPRWSDRVHLVVRPLKSGLGAAYREGFAWALDRHYDFVVQMDADLSHPPRRVPALLAALEKADVVVGSRYVPGGKIRNWPFHRRFISWAGNVYVRGVLDLPVRDATAGFKAYRRAALEEIEVLGSQSNGYCFQIENTWQAARRGMAVVEVPITFTDRARGQSKMSGSIVWEAVVNVFRWRAAELKARRAVAARVPA